MISWTFEKLAKSKTMNRILDYIASNPGNAARVLLLANVAKDAINCGFYVSQSLGNKNIPEEKRKFVASLDLANGILMITTQLLSGYYFTNKAVQAKITNKLFGKIGESYKKFIEHTTSNMALDKDLIAKLERNIENNKIAGRCKAGFTAISTVIITTVIAKRIVVPFIATPLATWFKNKYMDKKQPASVENYNKIDISNSPYRPFLANVNNNKVLLKTFNNFTQRENLFTVMR